MNDEAAPLERVFGGMMGVRLTEGSHTVRLQYRHPGLEAGLALTALCAAAGLLWYLRARRAPQRKEARP